MIKVMSPRGSCEIYYWRAFFLCARAGIFPFLIFSPVPYCSLFREIVGYVRRPGQRNEFYGRPVMGHHDHIFVASVDNGNRNLSTRMHKLSFVFSSIYISDLLDFQRREYYPAIICRRKKKISSRYAP